jgi:transcriptional regulator with XRE-family HTH domain
VQRSYHPASAYDVQSQVMRDLLAARLRAGLTQEEVARRMGTSKSTISRLEGNTDHSPSISSLWRYAHAVGYQLRIRLVPNKP